MGLDLVVSCLSIALVLMWVQSLYWEIPSSIWMTAAVIIGLSAATILAALGADHAKLGAPLAATLEAALILFLAAGALLVWFFRDPERVPPEVDGVILSPADGRIIYIRQVKDESHLVSIKAGSQYALDDLLQEKWPCPSGYLIGIEMNVLDVHVNRAPIAGEIVLSKRIPGSFPGLGKPNAEIRTERAATIIDDGKLRVAVVQIASRFVRGIVSYVTEKQQVELGQRIGMIRFGSQVDIALPVVQDCRITVQPGDHVSAGETVLARYAE